MRWTWGGTAVRMLGYLTSVCRLKTIKEQSERWRKVPITPQRFGFLWSIGSQLPLKGISALVCTISAKTSGEDLKPSSKGEGEGEVYIALVDK